jgi:hypothetical protein
MATRETANNTGPLLFSSPQPVNRQLPAIWIGGIVVALASVSGMFGRSLVAGEWLYVLNLLVTVFFVPTAAMAMGIVSGSKKLFEVCYLTVWYVGSIDRVKVLDLLGTTQASIYPAKLVLLVAAGVGLTMISYSFRRRQIAN